MADTTAVTVRPRGKTVFFREALTFNGETFDMVTFRPVTLGDVNRWLSGEFEGVNDLISELSGWPKARLEAVTYPDAGDMIESFMRHLPEEIREWIDRGEVPRPAVQAPATDEAPAEE